MSRKRSKHLPPKVPRDRHLIREWMTMGFYIAISLLASIGTIVETGQADSSPLPSLWGILSGLVVAHWFAFSLAAFATGTKDSRREDALHSLTGIAGAIFVGLLVTVTCLIVPTELETIAVTIVLVVYILIAAFVTARSRRAGFLSTVLIVVVVLALALGIILLKNILG